MKLHIPKPLVGLCLSAALCFTHRKLTLELPCSARGMPACFLPVSCPGPWQKVRQMVTVPGKSTWLPSRAICRAATGSQVALMSVSPVLGELRTGTVLGTLLQRDCHPFSIVTRLELIKGLVGTRGEAITHGNLLCSPSKGSRKIWHQWGWSGVKHPRDQQPRVPLLSHEQAEEAQPHHWSPPASGCLDSPAANANVWK